MMVLPGASTLVGRDKQNAPGGAPGAFMPVHAHMKGD